ncbi:MAG: hypothetical protein Q4F05_19720 [bacterium]|nr:hypothetical protein [bacterium]
MPRKNEEQEFEFNDDQEKEGIGSKIVSVMITLLVMVILLSAFAFCIKLDVGNVGTVLRPFVKDIPVVNAILPNVSDEELALENAYPFDNLGEAIERIKQLEAQVKALETSNGESTLSVSQLQSEVDRLKVYEENQIAFSERVTEFDTNVVFNEKAPEIEEYRSYYEEMNPENAAEIYRQVLEQQAADAKIIEQAERYSKMDPKAAASALQVMTGDLDLVANILTNMKTTASAAIMDEMEADFCAKITKKMSMME